MRNEMDILEHANPVSMDEAKIWAESDDAHRALSGVLDTVRDGVGTLEPAPTGNGMRSSWRIAAVAAVAVAAIVALPLALLGQRDGETVAPVSPTPVELGADHVWPDTPRQGSAVDLAAAFAVEVLGWTDATTTALGEADPTGQVWVRLEAPGRTRLDVLSAPTSSGGRVLVEVGFPVSIGAEGSDAPETWWVVLPYVPDATSGDVSVRPIDSERTLTIEIAATEMKARRLDMLGTVDIRSIGTLLVRYRDAAGNVITAFGGNFATEQLSDAELSPQEILSDGVVTEAEYFAAALAVTRCLRAQGIEASFGYDDRWNMSFNTPDSGGDVEPIFNSCHAAHVGSIETTWADQNAPTPEREIAFYNSVVDCVEAQTGEDYGDVGAVADTKATDAAIAAAPDLYMACLDQAIEDDPDLRLRSGP